MCNEQLFNEFICSISDVCTPREVDLISEKLLAVLSKYDVTVKETAIVEYQPFPDIAKNYLVTKKIEGLSPKTLNLYKLRLEQFFRIVRKPVEKITANDIRLYLYEIQERAGLSDRTLDSIRIVLNGFFTWANNEEYLQRNPCNNIKSIKYKITEIEPLTEVELEKIREACADYREKAIVEFLFSTGCRVSELVGTKVDDINFQTEEVKVTGKGNKTRTVYLNAKATIAIQEYLNSKTYEASYVFTEMRKPHGPLTPCSIQHILDAIGKRAGLLRKVHPHLFRHTTATLGLQRGMALEEVQHYLGHVSPSTTLVYAKIADKSIKAAHHKCIV